MVDQQLEKNYVISKLRRDLPILMDSWAGRSEKFRNNNNGLLHQSYGSDPREKLDIFYGGESHASLLIYFHGGYWQRGDKSIYSFIAKPFVEQGIDVAIVGYPLCPQAGLTKLVDSVRHALAFLYTNAVDLNVSRDRFNLFGNSAGGHLVAMMMATDWPQFDPSMPHDLIKFGAPISGLFDLEPLRHTSLNDAIRLDEVEASSNSPFLLKKVNNAPIKLAVGSAETPVFFSQMDALIRSWHSDDLTIDQYVEEDADHFDMIERLGDSNSGLFGQIVNQLR